jgi:hypothetical protein
MHAIQSPPHRALLAAAALTFLFLMLVFAQPADVPTIDTGRTVVEGTFAAEPMDMTDAGQATGMHMAGDAAAGAFDNGLPSAAELLTGRR